MRFSSKLSFLNLIIGVVSVIALSLVIYFFSYTSFLKSQMKSIQTVTTEISNNIDFFLLEKKEKTITLANAPIILNALERSNFFYSRMTEKTRNKYINRQDRRWRFIKNKKNNFILKYTNNAISNFFKKQQSLFKGEYGEIFLTNKFGALLASTSKLSTFAHGYKYWWLAAYRHGKGATFFDDRGYDDSVGGYVLGIVVPIKRGGEVVGILKCNLNIFDNIDKLLSRAKKSSIFDKLKLVRSGGLVVYEKNVEPLSERLPIAIINKMKKKDQDSFLFENFGQKDVVAFSVIEATRNVKKEHKFGGTLESIDHKKGNRGESWYVVSFSKKNMVLASNKTFGHLIVAVGLIVVFILVIFSYLFARQISKPLAILEQATKEIGNENFNYRVKMYRKDEFGDLGNSINQMTVKLQEALSSKKKAEQNEKMKTVFLSNMSHEIRTPLNVILGYTDLILLDNISNEHRKDLELIKSSGILLLNIINDILDLSKMEAGYKLKIELKPFSLKTFCDEIFSTSNILNIRFNRNLEIKHAFDNKISDYIVGDFIRLKQIMINLISNSFKFTEAGFVEFGVKLKEKEFLEFYVKDTGRGILKQSQKRIFDPFTQEESTDFVKFSGTGLGLTISKKLTELMHGSIKLESNTGNNHGTTVSVLIPYKKATVQSKNKQLDSNSKKINESSNSNSRKKILVAEDNFVNQTLAKRMIEKLGHDAVIANNGQEAIDIWQDNDSISLILMDIQMPVLNGFDACLEIRRLEKDKGLEKIPIVMLSAAVMPDNKELGEKVGADAYLTKPINYFLFSKTINDFFLK